MARLISKTPILMLLLMLCVSQVASAQVKSHAAQKPAQRDLAGPIKAEQALEWLPPDTVTVIVADLSHGPEFTYRQLPAATSDDANPQLSTAELWTYFAHMPLRLLDSKQGALGEIFKTQRILLAVEGSRHFRDPAGLGEMPFEGCEIVVFASDISAARRRFLSSAATFGFKKDQMEGQEVVTFEDKRDDDVWTITVAFPQPRVMLIATNPDFLDQVLARMKGGATGRAVPPELPEWKYVNMDSPFWGIRHYDRIQASQDPTSPIGGKKLANMKDDQAIGVTFQFDPDKNSVAKITYLSGDPAISDKFKEFVPTGEEGPNEWRTRFRDVAPGIIESSYVLPRREGATRFILLAQALLGHATYW